MGSHAGIVNFDGKPIAWESAARLCENLIRGYGSTEGGGEEGRFVCHRAVQAYEHGRAGIYRLNGGGTVIVDGRLFQKASIADRLNLANSQTISDAAVVGASYEKWGRDCFNLFEGEWSVAIDDRARGVVVLATDYSGAVPLYFAATPRDVVWSSELTTLVSLDRCRTFSTDYLVGSIWNSPELGLTPFEEVSAVIPGSIVEVTGRQTTIRAGWRPDLTQRIRYTSDREYEEHFRHVFSQVLADRLATAPVWAELSGGLDSSSIVCFADRLLRERGDSASRLRTVSYRFLGGNADDDRPYREEVNRSVGCVNTELDTQDLTCLSTDPSCATPIPAYSDGVVGRVAALMRKDGARVLLSGEGGDAVMWATADGPCLTLYERLRDRQWRALLRELPAFGRSTRRSLFDIALHDMVSCRRYEHRQKKAVPRWLNRDKLERAFQRAVSCIGEPDLADVRPTVRLAYHAVSGMRRYGVGQCERLTADIDPSYPYLDRRLIQFMLAVPFHQKLRPGVSRSLQRRGLAGVLPERVRTRMVKSVARGPLMRALRREWHVVRQLLDDDCRLAQLGVVDAAALRDDAIAVKNGVLQVPSAAMWSAVIAEMWIRQQEARMSGALPSPIVDASGAQ